MSYRSKLGASRKFDSGSERRLAWALATGDEVAAEVLVRAGGKHENRRARCQAVADRVLRQLGGFPTPELEPLAPAEEPLRAPLTPVVELAEM